MAASGDASWTEASHALKGFAHAHFSDAPSGLFYDATSGFRRRFSTYATGVYLTLGNFHYGEAFEDSDAITRAMRCVDALARCQGPQGEWPWFYLVPSGQVMDWYQVYSVHQDGMAPAYLHHAEKHGHPTAREQITRGFHWIFGKNEMGLSMLEPKSGVVFRSQIRKERMERHRRAVRAVVNWGRDHEAHLLGADGVKINRECRSYHLGWMLWSFGGRQDYPELTHAPAWD